MNRQNVILLTLLLCCVDEIWRYVSLMSWRSGDSIQIPSYLDLIMSMPFLGHYTTMLPSERHGLVIHPFTKLPSMLRSHMTHHIVLAARRGTRVTARRPVLTSYPCSTMGGFVVSA